MAYTYDDAQVNDVRTLIANIITCLSEFIDDSVCERSNHEAKYILRQLCSLHVDVYLAHRNSDEVFMAQTAMKITHLAHMAKRIADDYMRLHKEDT